MIRGPRIVSLLPSATEMVCAVGARENPVGVSHECDYPGVERFPVLTHVRRELPRNTGAIDRAVREILTDALAVYEVKVERLRGSPAVALSLEHCASPANLCRPEIFDGRST